MVGAIMNRKGGGGGIDSQILVHHRTLGWIKSPCQHSSDSAWPWPALMALTPSLTADVATHTSASPRVGAFRIKDLAPPWTARISSGSTMPRAGCHQRWALEGQVVRVFLTANFPQVGSAMPSTEPFLSIPALGHETMFPQPVFPPT